MKRSVFLVAGVFLLGAAALARGGTLMLAGGKLVEGDVRLEGDGVVADGKKVDLAGVERATFLPAPVLKGGVMTDVGMMVQGIGKGEVAGSAGIGKGDLWVRADGTGPAEGGDSLQFVRVFGAGSSVIAGRVGKFEGKAERAMGGIMMRENSDAGGTFVALMKRGGKEGGSVLVSRIAGVFAEKELGGAGPFFRLVNRMNTVTAETSADGKAWKEAGTFAHEVTRGFEVGFAAASGGMGEAVVVHFDWAEISLRGHQAEYFADTEMKEVLFRRVEPIVAATNTAPNSGLEEYAAARWTSEVVAPATEDLTFTVHSYFQSRLWVDGELKYESPVRARSERKDGVLMKVKEGQRIRLRLEYVKGGETAEMRFLWSSGSIGRRSFMTGEAMEWSLAKDSGRVFQPVPVGMTLTTGTFLPGVAESEEGKTFASKYVAGKVVEIAAGDVARLVFRGLSPAVVERLAGSKAGALMTGGDWLEASFRGMEGEKVKLSSILFGLQKLGAGTEVSAVVFGPVKKGVGGFRVKRLDGAVLCGKVRMEKGEVVVEEAVVGEVRVPMREVWEIERAR